MNEIALKLCDIQGRLFELSADHNYSSMEFIKLFMNVSATVFARCSFKSICIRLSSMPAFSFTDIPRTLSQSERPHVAVSTKS